MDLAREKKGWTSREEKKHGLWMRLLGSSFCTGEQRASFDFELTSSLTRFRQNLD